MYIPRIDLDSFISLVEEMRRNQRGIGKTFDGSSEQKRYRAKATALENKVDDVIVRYRQRQTAMF